MDHFTARRLLRPLQADLATIAEVRPWFRGNRRIRWSLIALFRPGAGLMEIQARRASEGPEPSLACASGLY